MNEPRHDSDLAKLYRVVVVASNNTQEMIAHNLSRLAAEATKIGAGGMGNVVIEQQEGIEPSFGHNK